MTAEKARSAWLDESSSAPIIAEKAQRLETFLEAVADGVIDESEIQAQVARLVALMKEVEPLLDDALHEKITQLLCELSAYDLMQVMHAVHKAKPKSVFRG